MKNKTKTTVIMGLFGLVSFLLASCGARMPKDLTPDQKDFYSKVRYIITGEEKDMFKRLPESERDAFIEEFWKKRDPEPLTEENEFKERYYQRIEEANKLFREGGTPGWLQDRGRIYILLGQPDERYAYPTGYNLEDRPYELWFYGIFPVVFVDEYSTLDYTLSPLSHQYLAVLNRYQMSLKPEGLGGKEEGEGPAYLDFDFKAEKLSGTKVRFIVKVPYQKIWLEEKGQKLQTSLILKLDVFEGEKSVWSHEQSYPVSLGKEEIMESWGDKHTIEVEAELTPGNLEVTALLENATDGEKAEKTLELKLK